jgi:importin-9
MHSKDPIFLSVLTDLFTNLASSSPSVYEVLVKQAVPRLTEALNAANNEQSWAVSSALDLLASLAEGAPESGLGEGFFATIAPNVFATLKVAEDRDVLQVKCFAILNLSYY